MRDSDVVHEGAADRRVGASRVGRTALRDAVLANIRLNVEEGGERSERLVEPARVSPGTLQAQTSRRTVDDRLRTPDDPVADEEREDVVPVLALCGRHVHLQAVAKVEERLRSIPVVNEAIERREKRYAVGNGAIVRVCVSDPTALAELHTEGAEPLLGWPNS